MKRFLSLATRPVFGSLLAMIVLTAAQADESTAKERQDFRQLLQRVADQSHSLPFSCRETLGQRESENVDYRIELKDEPQYAGAYFLLFTPVPDGRKWSTLIAYEGKRGFVMGNLTVKRQEQTVVFEHSFRGFLTDITRLVVENNIPKELHYLKLSSGTIPVQKVFCIIK